MAFKITKLHGAPQLYFYKQGDKRVSPTFDGVVVADRPPEHVFADPWLKVEPATAAQLDAFNKAEAKRARDAAEAEKRKAKDAAAAATAESAAGLERGAASRKSEIERQLSELAASDAALDRQLKAIPARAAAVAKLKKANAEKRAALEKLLRPAEPSTGVEHVSGGDPGSEKCAVCDKPEPHSHVPTQEEFVRAGYPADDYAKRFGNQKPGAVYDPKLEEQLAKENAEKAKADAEKAKKGK